MVRKVVLVISVLVFALGILTASVFRTISPEYAFSKGTRTDNPTPSPLSKKEVDYYLAYPGILPDHFIWPAKATRDKIWLFLTTDHKKKSELLLLISDKRIGAAIALFEGGKTGIAVETALKAEQYLKESVDEERKARESGVDTTKLLEEQLAFSALKHREILEEMYLLAQDDARVEISKMLDKYTKPAYDEVKVSLLKLNRPIPQSPFEE